MNLCLLVLFVFKRLLFLCKWQQLDQCYVQAILWIIYSHPINIFNIFNRMFLARYDNKYISYQSLCLKQPVCLYNWRSCTVWTVLLTRFSNLKLRFTNSAKCIISITTLWVSRCPRRCPRSPGIVLLFHVSYS